MLNKLTLLTICISLPPGQVTAQSLSDWQVSALAGVFAPEQTELQNIYGNGLAGSVTAAVAIGSSGRLQFGLDRFRRSGDPFYDSQDFNAGDAAELSLTGLSFTLQSHALTRSYPRLYFGAGLDYVFARENIREQGASEGQAVGAHLSIAPEIRLGQRLNLVARASYRFLEVTFKNKRNRYTFDLSGVHLFVGLGYSFGSLP